MGYYEPTPLVINFTVAQPIKYENERNSTMNCYQRLTSVEQTLVPMQEMNQRQMKKCQVQSNKK